MVPDNISTFLRSSKQTLLFSASFPVFLFTPSNCACASFTCSCGRVAEGAFLLGDIYDIRALLIDSFGRGGEVGQNGAGDGLTFGRWDDIAGKLRTFGRWERAEWKGNAATGSVGHMARKLTFGR